MKCNNCHQDKVIYIKKEKYCQFCGFLFNKNKSIAEIAKTGLASLVMGEYTIGEAWQFFLKIFAMKYLINKKQIPDLLKDIQLEIDYDVYAELNKVFIEFHKGSKRIPDYDFQRSNMPESVKPIENFFLIPALENFFKIPCIDVRELGTIYENNISWIDNRKRNENS